MADQETSVLTGREVLIGVTSLAAIVVFGCSIRLSHRYGDAARSAFLYLRIALCVFVISRLFDLISFILASIGTDTTTDVSQLSHAKINTLIGLTTVHVFLAQITDVLILVILLHLCIGIRLASLSELSPVERRIKHIIPVVGIAIGILAAASVVATIGYYIISPSSPSFSIGIAYESCMCVSAIVVGAWAIRIKLRIRGVKELNQAAVFLLVSCFLYAVSALYGLLVAANPANGTRLIVLNLIDVVFSTWPGFIILCLTFATSAKKSPQGLWTRPETDPDTPLRADSLPDSAWAKSHSPDLSPYGAGAGPGSLMMYDPHTGKTWEVLNPQVQHYHQQQQQQQQQYHHHELEQPPPLPPQELYAGESLPELPSPTTAVPSPVAEMPGDPMMLHDTLAGAGREERPAVVIREPVPRSSNIKLALRRGMDYF